MSRGVRYAALILISLALMLVLILFVGGWKTFVDGGLFARFERLADAPNNWQEITGGSRLGKSMLAEAEIVPDVSIGIEKLLRAQQWLGNQFCCVDVSGAESTQALWERGRSGQGLSCDAMARLFHEMVDSTGVSSRVVQLYRSEFDPNDTHVLVEVLLEDGHWVLLDPTFNVTFEDADGALLGVAGVRSRLASGKLDDIFPVNHGKRLYPASISDYYIDWRVLFGSAYVVEPCTDCSFWQRLPPLRYWYGPIRYAYGEDLGPLAREHNHFYFTVVVVYPLLAMLLLGAFFWLLFAVRND